MSTQVIGTTGNRKKQAKKDRRRIIRVVEYFDFSGIIENSPVQVNEGYVVADVDTNEFFATFTFQNLSQKSIKSLDIRLFLYRNSNVPYIKIPFTYSFENMTLGMRSRDNEEQPGKLKRIVWHKKESCNIKVLENFGKTVYIKIPESYFSKIKLEINSVLYANGEKEELGILVSNKYRHFKELDYEKQYAFAKVNIYDRAEEYHPTKVIPQKTQNAWLCCCGTKNLADDEICRVCGRDRDWQLETISDENLEKTVMSLKQQSDGFLRDKTKYKPYEKPLTEEEQDKKIKEYEKIIRRLAEQERINERKRKLIIPKIIFFFGFIYLLIYIIYTLTAILR